jgi:hypothetical protein
MTFCKLPDSQKAALMFLMAIIHNDKAPKKIKDLVIKKDWEKVALVASFGTPDGVDSPSIADFATVGNMRSGLQNAFLFLAMADVQGTPDGTRKLQEALNSHCWDKVANSLVSSLAATKIHFTGQDLHEAYAPGDKSPCTGPQVDPILIALGTLISTGLVVGDFFSKTLPDFFTNDFAKFFTGTVADFFTGDFANFFVSLGKSLESGFKDMASALEEAFSHLDPTKW